jgi:hypothetical protein
MLTLLGFLIESLSTSKDAFSEARVKQTWVSAGRRTRFHRRGGKRPRVSGPVCLESLPYLDNAQMEEGLERRKDVASQPSGPTITSGFSNSRIACPS